MIFTVVTDQKSSDIGKGDTKTTMQEGATHKVHLGGPKLDRKGIDKANNHVRIYTINVLTPLHLYHYFALHCLFFRSICILIMSKYVLHLVLILIACTDDIHVLTKKCYSICRPQFVSYFALPFL